MQATQVNIHSVEKSQTLQIDSSEIRNSMRHLPQWMQGFLTWLTTQSMANQSYPIYSSGYQVISGFLSMVIGVVVSFTALCFGENIFYIFLLIGWIVTVSGMRKLQVVIYHHSAHSTVFKSKIANFILGEALSIILVLKDFRTYKRDHMAHHNANKLLTNEDETAQDLGEIGLLPGIPKNVLWQRLIISLISPVAHTRWILNRFRNCFLSLNVLHNITANVFWVSLIITLVHFHLLNQFIIVWLFPLTILYHISRILRLVAEHRWPTKEINGIRGKLFVCLSTVAVCNGEIFPPKTENYVYDFFQVMYWFLKIIFIHLFVRIFILVGDTPCHDFHHRRPNSREWANYVVARETDKIQGCPGYPLNYTEIWGFFNAISINLKALSEVR